MSSAPIRFTLDDRVIEVGHLPPTTTLLRYLRDVECLRGTKEGCAEGDCGACTVVLVDETASGEATFRAVNSCLLLLPMLHGRTVLTVESLQRRETDPLHPVQAAVVAHDGTQCGYCTPGVVMSLFEAAYRTDLDGADERRLEEQMAGNLCRCTGYRGIREAAARVAGTRPDDRFRSLLAGTRPPLEPLRYVHGGQTYLQPTTLADLWAARQEDPDALVVAGGTDLGLDVNKRRRAFPTLLSLDGIAALRQIRRTEGGWAVGATATMTHLEEAVGPSCPGLAKMLGVFGSRQIRNRATLGGNLCNASPIGDMAPVMLALDAVAVLAGPSGEREVPMTEFFTGYRRTALGPDEILARVLWDDVPSDAHFRTYKVSKRRELDISAVSAAMMVSFDVDRRVTRARIAYGGVAATPVRVVAVEQALVGASWSRETVEAALARLEASVTPISDHRGSAHFRMLLAKNLLLGFFLETSSPTASDPVRSTGTVRPPAPTAA